MSARMFRRAIIAAIVILGLGAVGLVCQRVGERGRYALPYSTSGSGPEGTRALFLLAEREGAQPMRWTEDLGRIPAGAMLVALGGCDHLSSRGLSRPEREHLVRWVDEGGTLVVAGAPDYLPLELGVHLQALSFEECLGESGLLGMIIRATSDADAGPGMPDAGPGMPDGGAPPGDDLDDVPGMIASNPVAAADELAPEEQLPDPEWAHPVAAPLLGMRDVGLRRPAAIVTQAGADATTLLELDGAPAAVIVRRGRGRVIAIASASALQNRDLTHTGGAVLFARLLRDHDGPVLFDEYHLGAGERRSTMRYIAQLGLMPVVLQLAILGALFLWWRGARFGAARPAREEDPETTASFVGAVGALFAKSRDPQGALAILARHAIARIATHHHLDVHDPERLASELRKRKRANAADAVSAIAAASKPRDGARIDLARETELIDHALARALSDE